MDDMNIALLIDADNISSKYIPGILSELSKYGKITIRRMYGDWSQDRLHSWLACSAGYSLTPVMQPNNTPGKNASDIGLIIDAMDILYTGDVQGFCIVSSDGDFNKLATRLREAGKAVFGMGEKKTPESFRVSCERFIFLDIIDSTESDSDDDVAATPSRKARSATRKTRVSSSVTTAGSTRKPRKTSAAAVLAESSAASPRLPDHTDDSASYYADADSVDSDSLFTNQDAIENAVVKMVTDNSAEGRETGLGEVGSRLVKIFPDFDIRNYHYSKLSEYLKDFPSLNIETHDNAMWVTLNSSSDSDIEKQILDIFKKHGTDDMYITDLRRELEDLNPNLGATIRRSGVTRFSVYLNRMIRSVTVNGRHVTLKKGD